MITTQASRERAVHSQAAVAIPLQRSAPPVRRVTAVPPQTRRRWPATVGGLVAGLVVGTAAAAGAVGVVTARTAPASTPPAPTPRAILVADAGQVANVSVPGRVLTTFGDGTWQVGIDIAPGTYTTLGADDDAGCYHALRTGSARGPVRERAVAPEPTTVVLTEDDGWFETSGCATWTRRG